MDGNVVLALIKQLTEQHEASIGAILTKERQVPLGQPPLPGTPDNPSFDGNNATEYIERFELIRETYSISTRDEDIIRGFLVACKIVTRSEVKGLGLLSDD
jgi:hypothetical protein